MEYVQPVPVLVIDFYSGPDREAVSFVIPEQYPDLCRVLAMQIACFPDHETFLARRFSGESEEGFRFANELARWVTALSGDELPTVLADYRWLSGVVLEEEIFFRRNGHYRLSSFADALEQVYSNTPYMAKYMNGLLASQLWWRNHTEVMRYFRDAFIGRNPDGFSHLEVGPGHGLFLAIASIANVGRCEGWDISDASLESTREGLRRLRIADEKVLLRKIDLFDAPAEQFQSVTFSEVLEHLEEPLEALDALHRLLAPGGRIFINAPVNSPAPDHLYLFRTPEEVAQVVEKAGFMIEDAMFAPCSGATLERARRLNLTISAAVIGRK